MAKPAFIRYLPARLKPLGNPAVWVPLTACTLLGLFAWEYSHNPDWFNRDPITSLTPDSQLTPEEEAQLSEIDTLEVLLNGSRAPKGTAAVTSQINPDAPNAGMTSTDADTSDDDLVVDLNAFPIPGAASKPTTLTPAPSSVFSDPSKPTTRRADNGSGFNFGDSLTNTTPPANNSALADALAQREAALSAIEQSSGAIDPVLLDSSVGTDPNSVTVEALPRATPVPGAFIRTTPEMSPPVGTTGYQVPETSRLPTFNVAPQQPTRSPYSLPSGNNSNSDSRQFAVPTPPVGQVSAPAAVAAPAVGAQRSQAPSGLYTQPSSVQPDQGPVINPRR